MSDYIKREDVEQIFTEWCHKEQISVMFCDVIMRRLQRLPSADVAEVVRCKNCDFWNKDEDVLGGRCDEWSDFEDGLSRYTKPDDYCSYGERKEQENEPDRP